MKPNPRRLRRFAITIALVATSGCASGTAAPKQAARSAGTAPGSRATTSRPASFTVKLTPVSVDRLDPARRRFGALELLAAYELTSRERRFGGLSGLELSADGRRLIAISDRGHWFSATLQLADDGRLRGLGAWHVGPLRAPDGRPVGGRETDSEAITRGRDGAFYVAFEQRHRIWRYDKLSGAPRAIGVPPELTQAPRNGGLESLTTLPDGRFLAITERLRVNATALRGWLLPAPGRPPAARGLAGAGSRRASVPAGPLASATLGLPAGPLAYATAGDFVPTDLAAVPGGDVLVIERAFSILSGIRGRLRRIPAAQLRPGARLQPTTLLTLDSGLLIDNFEGLAVQAHGGRLLLYMVSDDNFSRLQRTLLYQFALPR